MASILKSKEISTMDQIGEIFLKFFSFHNDFSIKVDHYNARNSAKICSTYN